MSVADLNQLGPRAAALVRYRAAARAEGAACGKAGEIGRLAFDRHQPLAAAAVEPRMKPRRERGGGVHSAVMSPGRVMGVSRSYRAVQPIVPDGGRNPKETWLY